MGFEEWTAVKTHFKLELLDRNIGNDTFSVAEAIITHTIRFYYLQYG